MVSRKYCNKIAMQVVGTMIDYAREQIREKEADNENVEEVLKEWDNTELNNYVILASDLTDKLFDCLTDGKNYTYSNSDNSKDFNLENAISLDRISDVLFKKPFANLLPQDVTYNLCATPDESCWQKEQFEHGKMRTKTIGYACNEMERYY